MAGLAAAAPVISAFASVASVIGAFGKKSPTPPPIEKPVTMPTPDDDAVQKVKRRSIAQQLSRSGRQSTFLSEPSDTLGAA